MIKRKEPFFQKLKRIRKTKFKYLSAGEKVAKFVMATIKWAILITIGLRILYYVVYVAIAIALGIMAPFAIFGGFTTAINDQANRSMKNRTYIDYYK